MRERVGRRVLGGRALVVYGALNEIDGSWDDDKPLRRGAAASVSSQCPGGAARAWPRPLANTELWPLISSCSRGPCGPGFALAHLWVVIDDEVDNVLEAAGDGREAHEGVGGDDGCVLWKPLRTHSGARLRGRSGVHGQGIRDCRAGPGAQGPRAAR